MRQPSRSHAGCPSDLAPTLAPSAPAVGPRVSTPIGPDSAHAETKLPYAAGLDGLRAIAVIAVLLYHARDITGLPAALRPASGFLGVEVFFVISGYLITALLLAEHARGHGIRLLPFWRRRARRLLPALYLLLVGIIGATVALGDPLEAIRRELAAALLYVSNWLLIGDDSSYFEAVGRPSMLRHLWSLAVEEQFYLLWPVAMAVGLRWIGRWGLFVLTVAAAAASTAVAWLLFDQLAPYGDLTAIYYRTDARAAGLLIGAAAAFAWRPWLRSPRSVFRGRPVRWTLDVVGVAALAAVIWAQYRFTDQLVDWDAQQRLYHAGFLFTSIPTVLLISAAVTPGSQLGRMLGNRLLGWVGTRSYALYLWHWPIYQLTRPRVDVTFDGWTSLAVRLALTLLLAELSYRLVEQPIRRRRITLGGVGALIERLRPSRRTAARSVLNAGALVLVATSVAMVAPDDRGISSAPALPRSVFDEADPARPPLRRVTVPPIPDREAWQMSLMRRPVYRGPLVVPPGARAWPLLLRPEPTSTVVPVPAAPSSMPAESIEPIVESPTAIASAGANAQVPPGPRSSRTASLTVVGDSVVLGASSELSKIGEGVSVHGQVGRQWWEITSELRTLVDNDGLGDVVVIQLGNNGTLTAKIFDEVMALLVDVEQVLFVNVRVPKPWEADVNAEIAAGVARHGPRALLADWHALSDDHPEFFLPDGVHLEHPGSEALRELIESTLAN